MWILRRVWWRFRCFFVQLPASGNQVRVASAKKIEGAWTFRFLRPLLDCAAKFLRLLGSIWRENKTSTQTWQEVLLWKAVQKCAKESRALILLTPLHGSSLAAPQEAGQNRRGQSGNTRSREENSPNPGHFPACTVRPRCHSPRHTSSRLRRLRKQPFEPLALVSLSV